MTIFYLVCALLCMGAVLCNQYACQGDERMNTAQTIFTVVIGLTPFINAIVVALLVREIWKVYSKK